MTERWFPVSKPGADLSPVDAEPVPRADGATWQRFVTAHGKQFCKVVHAGGLVTWLQLIQA